MAAGWGRVIARQIELGQTIPSQTSELPKMVEEQDMQKATDLYEEMKTDIKALTSAFEQSIKELMPPGLRM